MVGDFSKEMYRYAHTAVWLGTSVKRCTGRQIQLYGWGLFSKEMYGKADTAVWLGTVQ